LIRAMREATGCIAVSHSLRELALRYGVEPAKVRVVHNAIDRAVFRPRDRAACRAELGIAQQGRIVVCIGHLTARKRHHVLIDAFARVRREHPDATLVVIGGKVFEPNYPQQLTDQVRRLGLEAAVRFEGNLPPAKVATWLAAADVFALGTAREGCCNAVLEALACGLPVVTTPVGDNAHFVTEGDNGYLSPVDDSTAMAAALARALQRSWDADAISKRLAVGAWDDVATQVLEFFRASLAGRHGASQALLPVAGAPSIESN
jgi:teichuronic acid biosynthesis glycosyltransferase TuaC